MKLVATAAIVLAACAFATGCHNHPTPAGPTTYTAVPADGGIPDAPGPKGGDQSLGFPGTNQH